MTSSRATSGARSFLGPSGGIADTASATVTSRKCWKSAASRWTTPHPSLGAGLCAGDRKAAAPALSARQPVAILARGRNMHKGQRETGVSASRGRQPWRHHRLPPVADPECKGRQAVPGQGDARLQGVGEALRHQHGRGGTPPPGRSGVEEGGQVPLGRRPQAGEIPQQRRRGRPWQAQAPDQADPWLQVDEDRLRQEGFEAMRAIKKRQARAFQLQPGVRGACVLSNVPSA